MKTLAILTNGGDTCALNASIKSIRDNAYRVGYKKIYGIRRGYQGLLDGSLKDITHSEIDVRIGGSCLGSLRTSPVRRIKIDDSERFTSDEQLSTTMAKCLTDYEIDVLVVIGGDGTLQATKIFQDWVYRNKESKKLRGFHIIGFLKTIDNDVRTFTHYDGIEVSLCPGFPSAVRKIVKSTEDLRVTARTSERAFLIECMGRDAGWLAAATSFGGAEILLVPEILKEYRDVIKTGPSRKEEEEGDKKAAEKLLSDFLERMISLYQKNRHVLIGVGEGFRPRIDNPAFAQFRAVIENLYGTRKQVGATELIGMLVSPVASFYFWLMSYLSRNGCMRITERLKDIETKVNTAKSTILDKLSKGDASAGKNQELLASAFVDIFKACNACGDKPEGAKDTDDKVKDEKAKAEEEARKTIHDYEYGKDAFAKYVGDVLVAGSHPLERWDLFGALRVALLGQKETKDNKIPNKEGEIEFRQNCLTASPGRTNAMIRPPYKFEIRPHRTDYVPRSGPPSAYDYKLATVLGEKVGEMLEAGQFGCVAALKEVVPYHLLGTDVIKTVDINTIGPLDFSSKDYFKKPEPKDQIDNDKEGDNDENAKDFTSLFEISDRITDFFRIITNEPEDLEEAIHKNERKPKGTPGRCPML